LKIAGATDNPVTLQRIAKQLFSSFCVDVKEVRGVGLKISRLEHADLARGAPQGNMLESWLASPSDKLKKHSTEKACLLKNRDDAGIGRLLLVIPSCSFCCKKCTFFNVVSHYPC
jgi:DNA repair protein REV1